MRHKGLILVSQYHILQSVTQLNKGGINMLPDAEKLWSLIDRWSKNLVVGQLTLNCPDDEMLANWVVQIVTNERLLSGASMELIGDHLLNCRICQSRLGAIEQPRLGSQITSDRIYKKILDCLEKYTGQTTLSLKQIDLLRFGPQRVTR